MINVESLPARTSRWELLRCPLVPTAERIVELPLVEVEVFNGNVVNQLEAPFIFAAAEVVCSQLLWSHLLAELPQDGVFQLFSGIGNPSP